MSEVERDGFTAREMYLMRQAMDAGNYYESLEQWLDETISDAGHYVAQHLLHDADRLYPQPKPEYTVDREYLVQLITERQKRIDTLEQQLQAAQAPASGEVDLDEDYPNFCIVSFGHKGYELKHEVFTDVESAAIRANELESKGFGIVLRQSAYTHPPAKVPEMNWKPSEADYDHSIHTNPDAKAWADFFMATFPNCGADRETMHGWFANAMMAMYDHLKNTPTPATTAEAEIPEGWKLVPIESTSEMDIAGMDSLHNSYEGYVIDRDAAETIWSAMVSATPTPPQEQ